MSAILGFSLYLTLVSAKVIGDKIPPALSTLTPLATVATSARVPLNKTFASFDADKNGFVSLSELAKSTGTTQENSRQPFKAADLDGNGVITESEFDAAPWIFDSQVARKGHKKKKSQKLGKKEKKSRKRGKHHHTSTHSTLMVTTAKTNEKRMKKRR